MILELNPELDFLRRSQRESLVGFRCCVMPAIPALPARQTPLCCLDSPITVSPAFAAQVMTALLPANSCSRSSRESVGLGDGIGTWEHLGLVLRAAGKQLWPHKQLVQSMPSARGADTSQAQPRPWCHQRPRSSLRGGAQNRVWD